MSLRRAAAGTAGWVLTAGGVLAIVVVVSGDYRFSRTAEVLVAVAAGLAVLIPFGVGVAYMAVRRRNRATESSKGQEGVSPRARALQASLASALDRVNDSTDDALGLRRVVLADRLELTATNYREMDDPWEALSFIWFVRPSQPADFPRSHQFDVLPVGMQDAVVLLDLRRDIQLRGVARALADDPGFYHHDYGRIAQAARRTGSVELWEALLAARKAAVGHGHAHESEAQGERLPELLDSRKVWVKLIGAAE